MTPAPKTTATVEIEAPAERVWTLVSDLNRMGEWSPETERVEWLSGAGPSVGAKFKGHNRIGKRTWSTTGTIVTADPSEALAWDVTSVAGLKVAQWRFEIESHGDNRCRLTESTEDQRGRVMKVLGQLATGVSDRKTRNSDGMRQTLERIKAAAEAPSS